MAEWNSIPAVLPSLRSTMTWPPRLPATKNKVWPHGPSVGRGEMLVTHDRTRVAGPLFVRVPVLELISGHDQVALEHVQAPARVAEELLDIAAAIAHLRSLESPPSNLRMPWSDHR